MKVLTQYDMDVFGQLLELAGNQGVLEEALLAVREKSTGTLQLRELIQEIIRRREPEVRDLLKKDPEFAGLVLTPA